MLGVGIIVHIINPTGGSVIIVGKEGVLLREKYPNGFADSNSVSCLQGNLESTENIEYYHGSDMEEADHYFLARSQELSATLGLRIQCESPKSTENHGWYTNYYYLPQDSRWTLPRHSCTSDDGRVEATTLLEELGFNIDKYSLSYMFPVNGIKFFLRIFGAETYQTLINFLRNGSHRFFDTKFMNIEDYVANRNTFEPISRLAIEHYDSLGYFNSLG
jgi:hypothetical protein